MMRSTLGLLQTGAAILLTCLTACTSTSRRDQEPQREVPKITHETTTDDALEAGIEFGGETARDVRKLLTKRRAWPEAEKKLTTKISEGIVGLGNMQLINATMIYLSGPVKPSEELFKSLASSERPVARQLAWQMAASLPSKIMRNAIEKELTRALIEGDEKDILIPQMAVAVQNNRMTSAYTMVRQGLMTLGNEEFAVSMATLDPVRASTDFIDYLALCPPDELRQLSVSSINVYAATVALNHLIKLPPPAGHPKLDIAFFYAISRNPGLGDLGATLVDALAVRDQRGMAIALSRLPVWTQVAFIENARRGMTATRRVFLSELKKTSPQSEVADELGEIKL